MSIERAILAGGCFWGMQDLIRKLHGVVSTRVGYTGGDVAHATYRNHGTHAEAIEITYDPATISFRRLLEFFFQIHDPTTLNRQGNDEGTQYRSAIYTHNAQQATLARDIIEDLTTSRVYRDTIVTEVAPVENYHPAEAYHQRYFEHHPGQGYCAVVIGPKVDKFRKTFADLLKVPSAG